MTPRMPASLPVVALLLLGAGVRALRFHAPFRYLYHWDETSMAIPALRILRGEFPAHFLGADYMGNSASYPLAVWFALAGGSPRALDSFAFATGLAMLGSGWLLARRLLAPAPARWALAVLAVPPLFLAARSVDGSLAYQVMLILGNVFLCGTHAVFFGRARPGPALLGLGLVAGVGIWTNELFLVYLLPFAVLAARRGLFLRCLWPFSLGAVVGGLPVWLHELVQFRSARLIVYEVGAGQESTFAERVLRLVDTYAPALLGLAKEEWTPVVSGALPVAAFAVLGVAVVVRAAVRDAGALRRSLGRGRLDAAPTAGLSLLWWVVLANVALVLLTQRGGTAGNRYVFPLFSVLPLWIGEALHALHRHRPRLGYAALAGLLTFQLAANAADALGRPVAEQRWGALESRLGPLVRWLEARGLSRVYWVDAPGFQSYQVTYWSGGRLVAADPWREPALPHARLVDAAATPAFVLSSETDPLLDSLRATGLEIRRSWVGPFLVVEPLRAPRGFRPLAPDRWTVTASDNPALAANLVDRDPSTGWTSGDEQQPGQWLAVDLGAEEEVTRLDLLAVDWQEVPAGFRVEISPDGASWRPVLDVPRYWGPFFLAEGRPFLKVRRGRVQAIFGPVRTRHLRLVQTGVVGYRGWSARELFVYAPGPPPVFPAAGTVGAALEREGVEFVYANAWLSAVAQTETDGRVRAQESNLYRDSEGGAMPAPETLHRFIAARGRAVLVGSDADPVALRAMLEAGGIGVREATAGPYPLLVIAGRPPRPRAVRGAGWRASASESAAAAPFAIDRTPGTAWIARAAGSSFTLDLGAARPVGGVRLRPGLGGTGARGVTVEASRDGTAWERIAPVRWAGALYWTGSELLPLGRHAAEWSFPPTGLRYLRLSLVAPAGAEPWVIDELELFE